jgi:hypothetical protein
MSDFDDSLAEWRAREEHENAAILLQDSALLKYAGLWRSAMVRRVSDSPADGSWLALWDCVEVNIAELADMADETTNRTKFQVRHHERHAHPYCTN